MMAGLSSIPVCAATFGAASYACKAAGKSPSLQAVIQAQRVVRLSCAISRAPTPTWSSDTCECGHVGSQPGLPCAEVRYTQGKAEAASLVLHRACALLCPHHDECRQRQSHAHCARRRHSAARLRESKGG